ncbi:hypothetical protein QYF36_009428 [Acer negundo]|nr:hypothetical protein QYF36_009428 [Acer negundo]
MIIRSSITCLICYEKVVYHRHNVSFWQLGMEDGAICITMLPVLIALDNVRQRFVSQSSICHLSLPRAVAVSVSVVVALNTSCGCLGLHRPCRLLFASS